MSAANASAASAEAPSAAKNAQCRCTTSAAVTYAPIPKNATCPTDGYPHSPPIRFQESASAMYMRIVVASRRG